MSLPIQIPKPCHEDWQQMLPEDKGRHCLVCQKTVIDFTQMSEVEIVSYFQQTPSGVCGRFRQEQLAPKPVAEVTQTSRWKMYLLALSATLALKTIMTETAKAQTPVEQREPQIPPHRVGTVADVHDNEPFTISGKVVDADAKEAIPGVSIVIKGTNKSTVTDSSGEFILPDVRKGDTVIISFIGFISDEKTIQSNQSLMITLSADVKGMVDVIVIKQPIHKRIFYRIKSWFQ